MPTKKKRVWNKSTGRTYTYDHAYNKRTIKQRSQRNKARRMVLKNLTKKYGKTKGKKMIRGKDVDHIRPIKKKGKNRLSNLRVLSISRNRARK